MKLSDLEKKKIIESLITTISHASDKKYQIRVWIKGQGPECEDFDDFVDVVLHENEALLKKYKSFGLNEQQYSLLSRFQYELMSFSHGTGRDYLPQDFIDTPEWNKIVEMAKKVLKAFDYPQTQPPQT